MAGTVTDQLKARKQAQGKPSKPAAKSSAKPAEPEDVVETGDAEEAAESKPRGRQKVQRTPEEEAARAAAKEERKKAAFEKLREMNAKKKAARIEGLKQSLAAAKAELMPDGKPGRVMYSTRASYYGVKCIVQSVEEVRGRILVDVLCVTTKGGQELDESSYYTRRFGLNFLQDEYPEEEYEPRRGGDTKRAKKAAARKARAEKKARKAAKETATDEEEAELDEDLDLEDDEENDIEAELDEDEEEDEDEPDEDEEEEDEDVESESASAASDEAEEDSWS